MPISITEFSLLNYILHLELIKLIDMVSSHICVLMLWGFLNEMQWYHVQHTDLPGVRVHPESGDVGDQLQRCPAFHRDP